MALSAAVAQEGVSRVSSYVSTKINDKASRAHNVARLEMAVSRLKFVLERTGKMPITYVSLLERWWMFKRAYVEGRDLLISTYNKHRAMEGGHQDTGQVVVRTSSSYLGQIATAAYLSVCSIVGLNNEQLSSSVVQKFEWYADCADKFVAQVVESVCPLGRDTFFHYPFTTQLFEGKWLRYTRTKGSQNIWFDIFPVILEGHGVQAVLWYKYFNLEKLDKSLTLWMMIRISESTDIIGIASNCFRSSASLLNLVAEDATGELTLLSGLQELEVLYPFLVGSLEMHVAFAKLWRPNPVCCRATVHHKPGVISSDLSHIFPEQVTHFSLTYYMPAAEQHSLPRGSDKAGRMMDQPPPLELILRLTPHDSQGSTLGECYISREVGGKAADRSPYGSIQQTIGTVRSEAIDCLIHQPEMTQYAVHWITNHGFASFWVRRASTDDMATVYKASDSYNTRSSASGAKRKR